MMTPMDPSQTPRRDPAPTDSGGRHAPLIESMTMGQRPGRTRRGNPIVPPDPGGPTSRMLAWVAAIIFAGLTIGWQNLPADVQGKLVGLPPAEAPAEADDQLAPSSGADMLGKVYLRLRGVVESDANASRQVVDLVEAFSGTQGDRIRTAVMEAEFFSPEAGIERLDAFQLELLNNPGELTGDGDSTEEPGLGDLPGELAEELAEELTEELSGEPADTEPDAGTSHAESRAVLLEDIASFRTVYTEGPEALDDAGRQRLLDRYGGIGEYALSFGKTSDERQAIAGSMWPILALGVGMIMVLGLGLIGGFGVLVFGLIWFVGPRRVMRGEKPEPGGSVMLETYALFVACFATLAIGLGLAAAKASPSTAAVIEAISLPMHWLLMLTVLWPLLRGMPFSQWRRAMGVHKGQGFFTEVGCGVLAYLASVPLYAVGVVVTMGLMTLWEFIKSQTGLPQDTAPPSNPVVELLGSGDIVVIIMMFTLATIWAPITEELIFRGALFRHFRGRTHWVVAGLLSATLFAFMHAYGPLMVTPLIVLGFMFAFMREWRGSIIAPMTAHFMHNFTLMVLMISALSIIG